jgi:hypothetical protein
MTGGIQSVFELVGALKEGCSRLYQSSEIIFFFGIECSHIRRTPCLLKLDIRTISSLFSARTIYMTAITSIYNGHHKILD